MLRVMISMTCLQVIIICPSMPGPVAFNWVWTWQETITTCIRWYRCDTPMPLASLFWWAAHRTKHLSLSLASSSWVVVLCRSININSWSRAKYQRRRPPRLQLTWQLPFIVSHLTLIKARCQESAAQEADGVMLVYSELLTTLSTWTSSSRDSRSMIMCL